MRMVDQLTNGKAQRIPPTAKELQRTVSASSALLTAAQVPVNLRASAASLASRRPAELHLRWYPRRRFFCAQLVDSRSPTYYVRDRLGR
jgi:hypothetical protein